MKTKACVTSSDDGIANDLQEIFSSPEFTRAILYKIVRDIFGVKDVDERPAEYYVQDADRGHALGATSGVEVRMTGISRNGRPAKAFHAAHAALQLIVAEFAAKVASEENKVQIFCVLMLDAEIETEPGSGGYSNVLERSAVCVGSSD